LAGELDKTVDQNSIGNSIVRFDSPFDIGHFLDAHCFPDFGLYICADLVNKLRRFVSVQLQNIEPKFFCGISELMQTRVNEHTDMFDGGGRRKDLSRAFEGL
jgi:hypothetical protein